MTMTKAEKKAFSVELLSAKECAAGAGGKAGDKRLSPEAVRYYISLIEDLPYADCTQALKRLMKKQAFFPSPAELRAEVKEIAEEREEANYKPYLERHPEENKTPEQRREIAKKLRAVLDKFNRVVADDDAKDGFTIRKAVSREDQ